MEKAYKAPAFSGSLKRIRTFDLDEEERRLALSKKADKLFGQLLQQESKLFLYYLF